MYKYRMQSMQILPIYTCLFWESCHNCTCSAYNNTLIIRQVKWRFSSKLLQILRKHSILNRSFWSRGLVPRHSQGTKPRDKKDRFKIEYFLRIWGSFEKKTPFHLANYKRIINSICNAARGKSVYPHIMSNLQIMKVKMSQNMYKCFFMIFFKINNGKLETDL